jgi:hypothetical protein
MYSLRRDLEEPTFKLYIKYKNRIDNVLRKHKIETIDDLVVYHSAMSMLIAHLVKKSYYTLSTQQNLYFDLRKTKGKKGRQTKSAIRKDFLNLLKRLNESKNDHIEFTINATDRKNLSKRYYQ